jgi:2-iminobutanoate/2-iminopropanoate deaminase
LKFVQSPKAPKPIGPYSQGVVENGLVFVAGTVAFDPATGNLVPGGIKEQTKRVLESVKSILEEGGSSLQKVTKVTVYLKEGSHFKDMNEVFSSYFGNHKPTRTTIVCNFVRDDILVEIDAIALA